MKTLKTKNQTELSLFPTRIDRPQPNDGLSNKLQLERLNVLYENYLPSLVVQLD
ncbi:MAG: hypothetical protein SGI87_07480 [Flavobacteriales bacterium]|nr:hypothetical protein [Flavobacteriales bacterium]